MKICPVGAELFHVEGRTDRQTDRQKDRQTYDKAKSLFAILQARLKTEFFGKNVQAVCSIFCTSNVPIM